MPRLYRFYLDLKETSNRLETSSKQISIGQKDIIDQCIKVLRLKEDSKETVSFFDGSSEVYETEVSSMVKGKGSDVKEIIFEIKNQFKSERELDQDVHFLLPIIKIENFEWMLRKVVELGAKKMTPILFARSQSQYLEKLKNKRQVERLNKIIIEATEQCEGAVLAKLAEPISFEDLIKDLESKQEIIHPGDLKIYASERLALNNGDNPERDKNNAKTHLLLGPEGGITDQENQALLDAGFKPYSLGKRLLKAETAAIALFSAAIS